MERPASIYAPSHAPRTAPLAWPTSWPDSPQRCLRSDRRSAYEQWSLPYEEAFRNELRRGVEVVESGETVDGATSFVRG